MTSPQWYVNSVSYAHPHVMTDNSLSLNGFILVLRILILKGKVVQHYKIFAFHGGILINLIFHLSLTGKFRSKAAQICYSRLDTADSVTFTTSICL